MTGIFACRGKEGEVDRVRVAIYKPKSSGGNGSFFRARVTEMKDWLSAAATGEFDL